MDFFFTVAGVILFIEAISYYMTGRDSTDKPKVKNKWYNIFDDNASGLRSWRDHATGVHYIKTGLFSNTVVRLDKDGKPYTGE